MLDMHLRSLGTNELFRSAAGLLRAQTVTVDFGLATGLKNDCASQCPAVTIVGSGAGSFKMEASSREKNSPSLK